MEMFSRADLDDRPYWRMVEVGDKVCGIFSRRRTGVSCVELHFCSKVMPKVGEHTVTAHRRTAQAFQDRNAKHHGQVLIPFNPLDLSMLIGFRLDPRHPLPDPVRELSRVSPIHEGPLIGSPFKQERTNEVLTSGLIRKDRNHRVLHTRPHHIDQGSPNLGRIPVTQTASTDRSGNPANDLLAGPSNEGTRDRLEHDRNPSDEVISAHSSLLRSPEQTKPNAPITMPKPANHLLQTITD